MMPGAAVSRRRIVTTGRRQLTRNVTENGEQDVDQEVGIAAALEEDTDRWQEDGEDDLDDVADDGRLVSNCKNKRRGYSWRRDSATPAVQRRMGRGVQAYLPVKGMLAVSLSRWFVVRSVWFVVVLEKLLLGDERMKQAGQGRQARPI
jgi:hypothetical protein